MSGYDDLQGEVTVAERLGKLIDQLSRNIGLDSDDHNFVGRVAEGVGAEVDLPRGGSQDDAKAVLAGLREAWARGSRQTGAALIRAYRAEEANNLIEASQILLATRDALAMPFYSAILDGERHRIEAAELN
ncbi:MAG: hypothetical protein OER77_05905 [Myxococcales bacterium]|nr:hypothetical protein [Myxococcales bacterium]